MDNLSRTLKSNLQEWTDVDIASYHVAVALGVAPNPTDKFDWGGKKWMFWTSNPLGEGLYNVLEMLAENGVLEKDEEESRFRWNPKFSWNDYGEEQTET